MANRVSRYPAGRRVLATDAIDSYGLYRTRMSRELVDTNPVLSVWLVLGDVEMDDFELNTRAATAVRTGLSWAGASPIHGFVITGDLRVHGAIHNADTDDALSLYVLGDLQAASVVVSGLELMVRGQVKVDDVLCGTGEGEGWFHRDVSTRLLISAGYTMWIAGRLSATVLEVPGVRVGLLGPDGMRAVHGVAPPSSVLHSSVLLPAGVDGEEPVFSFTRLHAAAIRSEPILDPAFGSGRFDVTRLRELRWLETQAASAMADGRYASAAQMFRAALERGAERPVAAVRLAEALYRAERQRGDPAVLAEALRLLDETLAKEPEGEPTADYAVALIRRASILLQFDEHDDSAFERAWADLDGALQILSDGYQAQTGLLAETYSLMGRWLYARRRYEECVRYLEQALSMDANLGAANGDLARALWLLDREQEALPYASRSLELNPTDDFLWYVRGKCYQTLGDLGRARADLQTYLELHPDDEFTMEALVGLSLDLGQTATALLTARRFSAAQPDHADAHARIGRLLHVRGMHTEAVTFLRRVVELDPGDAMAIADLAVSLTMLGGDTRALELAVRAMEISPGPEHQPWVRGECYRVLGDSERAEAELARYVEAQPGAATASASLARLLGSRGDVERAAAVAARARELDPDDEYVRGAVAEVDAVTHGD